MERNQTCYEIGLLSKDQESRLELEFDLKFGLVKAKDWFENGLMGDQPRMLGYAGLIADGRDRVECPTEKVHVYIRV